jgi:hypothetical protein
MTPPAPSTLICYCGQQPVMVPNLCTSCAVVCTSRIVPNLHIVQHRASCVLVHLHIVHCPDCPHIVRCHESAHRALSRICTSCMVPNLCTSCIVPHLHIVHCPLCLHIVHCLPENIALVRALWTPTGATHIGDGVPRAVPRETQATPARLSRRYGQLRQSKSLPVCFSVGPTGHQEHHTSLWLGAGGVEPPEVE